MFIIHQPKQHEVREINIQAEESLGTEASQLEVHIRITSGAFTK